MPAQFLRGDDTEVIGGPARLMAAPSTYPLPTRLAELISLTTYDPNPTYGFEDIGYDEQGITVNREVTEKEWRTDQFGLFKTFPIDYSSSVEAIAMQTSQRNREILMQASADADNADGEHVTHFEAAPFLSRWHLAVLYQDDAGNRHASVFPAAQWDGKAIKQVHQRGTPLTIQWTAKCYPSSTALGPNGYASDRYDIDEFTP